MKCKARVFLDRVFSDKDRAELSCLGCGKRWMLKPTNPFGAWLLNVDSAYTKANSGGVR
jgi:DNA-directed RNA polymerase subunit RPC12/RpoP